MIIRVIAGIVVIGFCVCIALAIATTAKKTPTGIGGWLLLLIVKLWISTGVRTLGGLAEGFSALGLLSLGFAVLAGVTAYLLGRKNAKGVMLAKVFLAANAAYYVLVLLDSMLGSGAHVSAPFPPWFKPSGYFIACVLWLVYLARSKRVKNTYFPALA